MKQRVALVTGGGRGIGREAALEHDSLSERLGEGIEGQRMIFDIEHTARTNYLI